MSVSLSKSLVYMILLVFTAFVGCSSSTSIAPTPPDQNILHRVVTKVAMLYGDSQAQIGGELPEITEQGQKMTIVGIIGTFVKSGVTATHIGFSMLNDGSEVWDIRALDNDGTQMWIDTGMGVCPC